MKKTIILSLITLISLSSLYASSVSTPKTFGEKKDRCKSKIENILTCVDKAQSKFEMKDCKMQIIDLSNHIQEMNKNKKCSISGSNSGSESSSSKRSSKCGGNSKCGGSSKHSQCSVNK